MLIRRPRSLDIVLFDDTQVVMGVPRHEFRFGFACLAFGVGGALMPAVLLALGHRDAFPMGVTAGFVGAGLLGGLFVFVGGVLAGRIDRLRLELDDQTYEFRTGYLAFATIQCGTFLEFDRLTLGSELEHHGEMQGRVWRVWLCWKDPNRPAVAVMEAVPGFANMGRDKRQMAIEAMLRLSACMEVPAYDEAGNRLAIESQQEM